MKLSELLPEWEQDKKLYIKESSLQTYLFRVKNYILPEFGDTELKDITTKAIQSFLFTMLENTSRRTAMDTIVTLKIILRYAIEQDYMPDMNFRIKYPSVNKGEQGGGLVVYDTAEQKKIINYILEHMSYQRLGILVCFCTGLRIGEICGLQFGDIDLDHRCIRVSRQVQRIYDFSNKKSKIMISGTKTRAGTREVPILNELYAILKNFKKIANDEYYVLTGTEKFIEPRTYRNFYRRFILEDVKLSRCIHFHGIRHSFASRMIEQGADVKTTSKILGHTDVSTTMNLYVHPTGENKLNAVNKSMKGLFKK
jgi:integrase